MAILGACRTACIPSLKLHSGNLHLIAGNLRFLVLPWVRVPHLASHILGRMARQLSDDWERMYGHPLYFLEAGERWA